MTKPIAPLTERPAWKALEAHYQQVRELHLRKLFADDPEARRADDGRGGGPLPGLLEESHHRRNPQAPAATGRGIRPARAHRRHVPGREDQHHGKSRRPARGPARAERRRRSSSMARTWCRRSTPCSTRWLTSPTACGAARGRATPASAFATSSTSASAAPTSGR